MTKEQLSKAISMDQALINCQHELKRIDSVNALFCNGRKADRSIYDETISTMVLHVETSNGKKISIDLPKDSSIGHELITTLENFYREKKKVLRRNLIIL